MLFEFAKMRTNAKRLLIGTLVAASIGLSPYILHYKPSQNHVKRDRPREGRTLHGDHMYDIDRDGLVDIIRRERWFLAAAKGHEKYTGKHLQSQSFHIMGEEERKLASEIMVRQEELDSYMRK